MTFPSLLALLRIVRMIYQIIVLVNNIISSLSPCFVFISLITITMTKTGTIHTTRTGLLLFRVVMITSNCSKYCTTLWRLESTERGNKNFHRTKKALFPVYVRMRELVSSSRMSSGDHNHHTFWLVSFFIK